MARIYEQDVLDLQGPLDTADSKIRVIGSVRSQELTGYTGDRVIEMEVCLLNHRDPTIRETQWMRIQCAVAQGICPTDEPKRLDGPWLRWIMYNAFVPKSNEIRIGSMTTTVTSLSDAPQRRAHKPPTLPADGAPAPYTLQVASSWKPQDG